jgi:hypothetical protein
MGSASLEAGFVVSGDICTAADCHRFGLKPGPIEAEYLLNRLVETAEGARLEPTRRTP